MNETFIIIREYFDKVEDTLSMYNVCNVSFKTIDEAKQYLYYDFMSEEQRQPQWTNERKTAYKVITSYHTKYVFIKTLNLW